MSVSSKCYYAIRAIYALAENNSPAPMKISDIAEREKIPIRFLEVILSQLKGAGSCRASGVRRAATCWPGRPSGLTIGEIMRYVDGPIAPVDCVSQMRPKECQFLGDCHFFGFWGRVRQAISDVVDRTTFADIVRENRERKRGYVGEWVI